jgi:hypothetical protein
MNLIIVVPSYNMNEQCYKNVLSLQNQMPEAKFLVVNNSSKDREYLDKLPSTITVEDNVYPNSYEAGALLHAYNKYEFDNYFLIQDSIEMFDCFEIIDYVNKDYNFVLALNLFCPAAHMTTTAHKDYIKDNFKTLSSSMFMKAGIATNSFIAKRSYIQQIIDAGIFTPENLPKNKLGSECWERVFGLAFSKFKIDLKCFQASYSRQFMNSIPGLAQHKIAHILRSGNKFHKFILARS